MIIPSCRQCDRKGCHEKFCGTVIRGHGYICNSCLKELKKAVDVKKEMPRSELEELLTQFFNTPKTPNGKACIDDLIIK